MTNNDSLRTRDVILQLSTFIEYHVGGPRAITRYLSNPKSVIVLAGSVISGPPDKMQLYWRAY